MVGTGVLKLVIMLEPGRYRCLKLIFGSTGGKVQVVQNYGGGILSDTPSRFWLDTACVGVGTGV